jgi:HD superfamily phosphohydrolase YqeK
MRVTELSSICLSNSRFEHVLRSGKFAITVESKSPDSANPEEVCSAVTHE